MHPLGWGMTTFGKVTIYTAGLVAIICSVTLISSFSGVRTTKRFPLVLISALLLVVSVGIVLLLWIDSPFFILRGFAEEGAR